MKSDHAEWVTAETGLFGTFETFLPIRDADVNGQERKLYEYEGMDYNAPMAVVDPGDGLSRAALLDYLLDRKLPRYAQTLECLGR